MISLLDLTRMTPFRRRRAGHLSGGMKQKLALMCALLHRPKVLLLDEPTTGVDPVSRRDFWQMLYRVVRDGMTVLITTAYLDEAERCSRVGLIDKGRLIRCDTPNALQDQLEEDCYEIHCGNPRAARDLLTGSPGVSSVEFSGYTLHLFLSPSETSPEVLQALLEQGGCTPARLIPIRPSMDDVFIALVGRPTREAA
jgi:ABC-2 type transport system ATP-binding protein